MCKIWELLGQYPRRNNLSKLATFDPICQLPHSAMSYLGPADSVENKTEISQMMR